MNRSTNQTASALLITILIATFLLTSLTVLWRVVSVSYESAMLHYKSKQNFYACESLILYGIGLIKADLILLNQLKPDQKQIIYQGNWPKQTANWGVLSVNYHPKLLQLELEAKLFNDQHLVPIVLTNVLFQKELKELKFKVINWQNS